MYTDATSLHRRSPQVRLGSAIRLPLLLLGVKSGQYIDACLPRVWVVLVSCLALVVKRSSGSVS